MSTRVANKCPLPSNTQSRIPRHEVSGNWPRHMLATRMASGWEKRCVLTD
jgi:hypothetical protein